MTRRLMTVLTAAALSALAGCARNVPPSERSVILVTLDTTRADRIGAFGGQGGLSPHIDRMAESGTLFEEAICQVPLTLPSHSTILTSRYPASHGVRHNGIYVLSREETTLTERLKEHGFDTAAFVASFVLNRGFGVEQGFDTFDDVPVNRYAEGQDQVFLAQRRADEVNASVFKWLDKRKGKPGRFFLWVHYYDPHDPYDPPDKPGRTLKGKGYDREISYMDAAFGDLIDRLKADGVLDRSILWVTGDHGESLGEHGERQHGIFLYEPAVHVPMFVRAPGLVPSGGRVKGPVELADIAPTILDLVALPALEKAQGKSLRARIEGRDDGRGALAHAESLMPRLEFGWSELRMVRDARFKFVEAPRAELYDLRADPKELVNLEPNDAERAGELSGLLKAWVAATTDAKPPAGSTRALDPEEEARLRSLGYLGGDAFKSGAGAGRVDPKDGMLEVRDLLAARELLDRGDAAGALLGVEKVLKNSPLNHQALATKIHALVALKRLPEAEDQALAALGAAENDPDSSMVLVEKVRGLLAMVLLSAGRSTEAENQYRKILEHNPKNEGAAVDLSWMLLQSGRFDEAGRLVEQVLKADARNGMALAARFQLERRRGDQGAMLKTAESLADERAGDRETLSFAGRMLAEAGQPARAAACFEVALAQEEVLDPSLLLQLGGSRLAASDLKGAEEAFRAAEQLLPHDPRPPYYLGLIALRQGREADAKVLLDRALEADRHFAPPAAAWGRYLASRGRREEAAKAFREALRRNPEDGQAAAGLRALESGASKP